MRKRKGYILVQVLVVVATLAALMAMLAANQRVALKATQNKLRERRAEAAAQSAIAIALSTLQNANANLVTQNDDWYLLGSKGAEAFSLGDATLRLEIVDAGAFANVNTISEESLQLLPITQEQIDSLLDWREGGVQPRSNGAKDDYYNTLTTPYNAKLGRIATLSELLLIQGWTARDLYALQTDTVTNGLQLQDANGNDIPLVGIFAAESGSPNTRADGTAKVNLGQGNININAFIQLGIPQQVAATLVAGAPYTSFQDLFSRAGVAGQNANLLLDAATFVGGNRLDGKINLNTATQSVFETIPNMTPEIAASIVSQQGTGFQTMGDLANISGLSGDLLGRVADACTVGSDTWVIRAYGESGGVRIAIEAVARLTADGIQLLTWERVNALGIPLWWGWDAEPTSTTDLGST